MMRLTAYLFFTFAIGMTGSAQNIISGEKYDYLIESGEYLKYFKKIDSLSDIAYNEENAESLFQWSEKLRKEFPGLNAEQRKALREVATYMGQKILNLTGNINNALIFYLIAHENVENKETLDLLAWNVENRIVVLYTMKGDYEKADYYSNLVYKSLKFFEQHEKLSRYYSNLGRKLKTELKLMEAMKAFKTGLHLADSIQFYNGIFANAFNLCELFNDYTDLGNAEEYLSIAGNALIHLKSDTRYFEKLSAFQLESARILSNRGQSLQSIPIFKSAIDYLDSFYLNQNRREFARLYRYLANEYFVIDSLSLALKYSDTGLRKLIPEYSGDGMIVDKYLLYAENNFIDIFKLKANISAKLYNQTLNIEHLENALNNIESALYVNDLIRQSVVASPSKLLTIISNKNLIDQAIIILHQLYSLNLDTNYFIEARKYFNNSKSVLFGEKTGRIQQLERFSNTDLEKWRELNEKLTGLYDMKVSDSNNDINTINKKILDCLEQIDSIYLKYHQNDLQASVPTSYIEYAISAGQVYVIAELNHQIIFKRIGEEYKLSLLVDRMRDFVYLKSLSTDNRILQDLYDFLIRNVTDSLPEHVVIIPDGMIGYIPFEMLCKENNYYLVNTNSISYSFQYASKFKNEKTDDIKQLYCLVPKYLSPGSTSGKEPSRGGIYHLPYAEFEGSSICSLYTENYLLSRSSSKTDWENNIKNASIFHFAGHAIVRGNEAYLALSGDEVINHRVSKTELELLHLPMDLVVLSACETGLGELFKGEGISSLGRAFMQAGAKSTVISLWNVNDKSTAFIMTSFYARIRQGMRKDEALRLAKLDYLNSSKQTHPYYWAAFIANGDMSSLE